jgi:phosphonoacetaldehyde hydrolase
MVRACIFNLSGVLIDRYSYQSFSSLRNTFLTRDIKVSNEMINKYMGLHKKDHIRNILQDYYRNMKLDIPSEDIYTHFYNIFLFENRRQLVESIDIIPDTKFIMNQLTQLDIDIGITSDYDKMQVNVIKNTFDDRDIPITNIVYPNCYSHRAPLPYMIYETMKQLSITSIHDIVKVDSTLHGIKEGSNAGCKTIGIARWSPLMGIYNPSDPLQEEIDTKLMIVREELVNAGADYVIDTLDELPGLLKDISYG